MIIKSMDKTPVWFRDNGENHNKLASTWQIIEISNGYGVAIGFQEVASVKPS